MEEKPLNFSQTISQDEIYDFFGGINIEKILARKVYPVWAFTNEDLKELSNLTSFKDKEIFAILGSADQSIYFFSKGAKQIVACDNRDLACLFSEFKISALKNLSFQEFKEIFLNKEKENSKIYFEKIRTDLSQAARKLFDWLLEGQPKNIFLTLQKSQFFYKESWCFLKKKNWLPYFDKSKEFSKIKKRINRFFIINADLITVLKKINKKFDLIYTSNIFESRNYCPDFEKALLQIDLHLKEEGEILIVNQDSPKKILSILENLGYNLTIKETKKKFLEIFSKSYSYYYILAKKK